MILSLKVISPAMNYQDGLLPEKDLRETQKKYRLTRLPTPLEFFGFVFSDGTLLAGPPFEIADYLAYTERKRVR
jgi:lysophospholipid acyltransferase